MSGPKSSRYNIEARKRRVLQMELERKIAIEKEKVNLKQKKSELEAMSKIGLEDKEKYVDKINYIKTQLSHMYKDITNYNKSDNIFINENLKRDLEDVLNSKQRDNNISRQQQLLHMEVLLESSKMEIQRIIESHGKGKKQDVNFIKKIDQEKLNFENLKEVQVLEHELDSRLKNFENIEIPDEINSSLEVIEKNKIIEFVSNSSNHNPNNLTFGIKRTTTVEERVNEIEILNKEHEELNDLIESYLLTTLPTSRNEPLNFKKSLDSIMFDDRFDTNYKLTQLQVRKEAFLLTKDKYDNDVKYLREEKQNFDNLYGEYHAICNLLDIEAEEFSIYAIDSLKIAIKENKETLSKDNEARYISESINEVMEELGYDIVASDYMETPKRNILENIYDLGSNNVVSVYTSDNGSLMFDVSGIKEKEELSSNDKLKIKEGMDRFCPEYEKIKEALVEKGIRLNNENLLPPDVKYSKAIDLENKKGKSEKSKKDSRRQVVNKPKHKTL